MTQFDTSRIAVSGRGTPQAGNPYVSAMMDLRGGINNSVFDELIAATQLSDARNYMPDHLNSGVLIKRPGLAKQLANAQTLALTSIYQGKIDNFFTAGATIKTFSSNTDLAPGGYHATASPDWASMGGMDIIVNGTDVPQKITAGPTVATLGGTPPATAKYVEAFSNFVWMAGHSGGVLRYSQLATTETWPSANSLTVTNDANDDITGLIKFYDTLMVMCAKSFHRIKCNQDLGAAIVYSNYQEGCASHRSLVPSPYGLFWWSDVGLVCSVDGYTVDYPALRLIPNTLELLARGQYSKVHGCYHPRLRCVQMYVCSSGATTEDMAVYYFPADPKLNRPESCWIMTGVGTQMGASGSARISGLWDVFLGSAGANGYLFKQSLPVDTDDGTPISAYLETQREALDYGIKSVKVSQNLMVCLIGCGIGSLDYSVFIDNNQTVDRTWSILTTTPGYFILGSSLLGTGILGSGSNTPEEHTIGYGRAFHKLKHRLSDNMSFRTRVRGFINSGYIQTIG